jgi:hypothetical protein
MGYRNPLPPTNREPMPKTCRILLAIIYSLSFPLAISQTGLTTGWVKTLDKSLGRSHIFA